MGRLGLKIQRKDQTPRRRVSFIALNLFRSKAASRHNLYTNHIYC
jgi:hypothetical protein